MARANRHENPRDLALAVLVRVEKTRIGSQEALTDAIRNCPGMSTVDKRLATELLYGCLRWRDYLDHQLLTASGRGSLKFNAHVTWALRMGAYQIQFLDRIPSHAAVDNAVRQSKSVGGQRVGGFVNAVLRKLAGQPGGGPAPQGNGKKALSVRFSHPEWVIEELKQIIPPDQLEEACRGMSVSAPVAVRCKPGQAEKILEELTEHEGVEVVPGTLPNSLIIRGGVDPLSHPNFRDGKWIPQDEGSQAVVDSMGPIPGGRLLDYCAGTGTKTTHLWDKFGKDSAITACDVDSRKLEQLKNLCESWGFPVTTKTMDGRKSGSLEGTFDGVIVDAPCTGLGTVRRRPEIKWRRSSEDLKVMGENQVELLHAASSHVAPGGLLVYAVCSFTKAESEDVVNHFLARTGNTFSLASFEGQDSTGMRRILPGQGGMDGFFYAHFRRAS